jgi:nitrite reductase (NADH) small subunit
MKWIRVTTTDNIPLREGRCIQIGDEQIAVFNLGDRFAAVDNACPHRGGPLCDGIVSGETVTCPLHGYKISLETGHVTKPDVQVPVGSYPVRVEDGVVLVEFAKRKEKAA